LCRLPLLSAVVVQGFYRGVSVAELAARYGIGVDSVKKRLFRSRQVLRNWLETRVAGAGFEDGA
jgi:DNA-directed RNA polymerase specialized sigma24 family protein